jgi:hypothetical protein
LKLNTDARENENNVYPETKEEAVRGAETENDKVRDNDKGKGKDSGRAVIDIYLKGGSKLKSGLFKSNRAILFSLALLALAVSLVAGCTKSAIDNDTEYADIGNPYVALVIEPKDAKMITGTYKQFAVNAVDLDGKYTKVAAVVWSTTYGHITVKGELVAPEEPGYAVVTAKFANLAVSTQVYIESSNQIKEYFVVPESGEVEVGRSAQLVFRARNAAGEFLPVLASWSADNGNITNTGYYSAPGSPTMAKITARVGRLEAYSYLSIISVRPHSIAVSPSTATVAANASQQFTAIAYDERGNVVSPKGIIWTTTYGQIASDGLYTSPASPAAALVMAHIGNVYGVAYINTAAGATATSLDISPVNAVMRVGESRQFAVIAYDSNGVQVALPTVATWSAVNGSVNSNGIFTAYPASPGLATLKVFSGTLSKEITLLITE